jgi:hypothetical protein
MMLVPTLKLRFFNTRKSTIGSFVLNPQITNAANASTAKIAALVINDD